MALLKISYRTVGSGSYSTLADSGAGDFVTRFLPRMTGTAQTSELFRSSNQFVAARGNRTWSLAFAVDKQHASIGAALAYLATHPAAIPDGVDLKIEDGASTAYLANAVFVGFTAGEPNGVSTTCTYQFVGQSYTTTAP